MALKPAAKVVFIHLFDRESSLQYLLNTMTLSLVEKKEGVG